MAVLNKLHIKNFRVHKDTLIEKIGKLLALVGKNDIGKSSVLDSLDVFFNDAVLEDDFNNKSKNIVLECTFCNEPITKVYSKNKKYNRTNNRIISNDEIIEYILFKAEQHENSEISDFTIDDLILVVENQISRYLDRNSFRSQNAYDFYRRYLTDLFDSFGKLPLFADFFNSFYPNRDLFDIFFSNSYLVSFADLKHYTQNRTDAKEFVSTFSKIFNIFRDFKRTIITDYLPKSVDGKLVSDILFGVHTFVELSETIKYKDKLFQLFDELKYIDVVPDILDKWKTLLLAFNTTKTIKIGKRGSGVKRICSLYYHIMQGIMHSGCRKRKYIFAIDEPEISLHPEQQRVLVDILKQVTDSFDNIQIIITSHSPFILNKLDDNEICVLPKDDNRTAKRCIKVNHSINETIYIAFDEPTIAYHQELFGYIHNVLIEKYENDPTFPSKWKQLKCYDKNGNPVECDYSKITAVDAWIINADNCSFDKTHETKTYQWYNVKYEKDKHTNTFSWNYELNPKRSLPYCVRNYIDHPLKKDESKPNNDAHNMAFANNRKYADLKLIKKSIEIMRKSIFDNNF